MMNPKDVSACLITKDEFYPPTILNHVHQMGFGEVMVLTNCDSPHRKQELFAKARYKHIYYQDDDCIAPIRNLFESSDDAQEKVLCAMKPHHLDSYAKSRIALLGWGSLFPKDVIDVLVWYRRFWGEDKLYRRETERIMTHLSYDLFPQKRLNLPIFDLPSAYAPDRLSMQPDHYSYIPIVEERCAEILSRRKAS